MLNISRWRQSVAWENCCQLVEHLLERRQVPFCEVNVVAARRDRPQETPGRGGPVDDALGVVITPGTRLVLVGVKVNLNMNHKSVLNS